MKKDRSFIDTNRKTDNYRAPAQRLKDFDEIYNSDIQEDHYKEQTSRCMDCGVPFCQSNSGCPIGNLIPEWNELIFNKQWKEAYIRLAQTNNFPEVTGRVCPAVCEGSCTLNLYSEAVTIKNIEKAISDMAFKEGWVVPIIPSIRTGKKIAIVGSGPAGLSAADELNKLGHIVTVFEKADRIGGLMMYGIPNMKLSKSLLLQRIDLLEKSGIIFKTNTQIGKDIQLEKLSSDYDAVIVSTGSTIANDIPIEGRELKGVHLAMEYLTASTKSFLDKTKPAIDAKGKKVIVIGAGDTGTDCIATALRQGAKSLQNFDIVPMAPMNRKSDNPWPEWPKIFRTDYGHEEAQNKSGEDPRIYKVLTKKFLGTDGNVTGLETVEVEWEGRSFKEKPNSTKKWDADLVFLSLGFKHPDASVLGKSPLEKDARGNFKTESSKTYYTKHKNVFVAGDCHRGQSLVVWAIKEGRAAAEEVNKFVLKTK